MRMTSFRHSSCLMVREFELLDEFPMANDTFAGISSINMLGIVSSMLCSFARI